MPFPVFVLASCGIASATVAGVLLAPRRWMAIAVALAGATGLVLFHGRVYFDYYADDSFITLRYAKHLAEGLGPNWNSHGRVEGYTSFLWMAGLAGFAKLGADLVETSRALGLCAIIATFAVVFLIWGLWSRVADGSGVEHPLVPAAALLGLGFTDSVSFWGFSGMETPLFMALLSGSAYLFLREQRAGGSPWSAFAFAATAMTRPEGLIAAGVTGAFLLAGAVRDPDRSRALERALLWGGVFVVLYGSYFAWRYTYYDHLLPNTYYAKVDLNAASLDRGLRYIADSGLQYHVLAMFIGVVLLASDGRLRLDAAYVFALAGAMVAGVIVEGGGDVHGRFLMPLLPLLFLAGLSGYAVLLRRAALGRLQAGVIAGLTLSAGALALLPASYDELEPFSAQSLAERRALGSWFNQQTPADFAIADFQIGAVAYYSSDRESLDLLGLNDETIARAQVENAGSGVPGHERYDLDYVFDEARPEIISIGQATAHRMTADEVRQRVLSSALFVASRAFFTDPRLWEQYDIRAVELGGRWYHFLQREDTVSQLQAPGLH